MISLMYVKNKSGREYLYIRASFDATTTYSICSSHRGRLRPEEFRNCGRAWRKLGMNL